MQKPVIILAGMRSLPSRRIRSSTAIAACIAVLAGSPQLSYAHDADEIALGSLVDAELSFARMALERGIRDAFLANFADDGIAFEPAPVRLREAWSARPPARDPKELRLEWKPAQAGVARSRDFGYTTGPYTLSSAAHPERVRHGVFFSVWRRDAGRWRVVLDAGIATPAAVNFASLGAAPRPHFKGRAIPRTEKERLLEREADLSASSPGGIPPAIYAKLLAPDARLHRDGAAPVAADAAVREASLRTTRVAWTPSDARVSASGDMAVTYGRFRETDGSTIRDGYYAHLWLRDAGGRWRLAYDIMLPGAPA